jgi:hypothetical protein
MSHPHDNGGRSSIMRGAGGGTAGIGGAYGDFGLSQGVFTVMSYNDGWDLRPNDGTPRPNDDADNGWVGTLSPLDIAVIQDKYGVNENYNTGDNVYVLKDKQETGTFYASIWDAGGTDSIVYNGARAATVDLRAATLKYEEGGGGRVSYVQGIHGGFTIANGVTIENVRTDAGNDVVNGNAAANRIETRAARARARQATNSEKRRSRVGGGLGGGVCGIMQHETDQTLIVHRPHQLTQGPSAGNRLRTSSPAVSGGRIPSLRGFPESLTRVFEF